MPFVWFIKLLNYKDIVKVKQPQFRAVCEAGFDLSVMFYGLLYDDLKVPSEILL